MVSLSLLADALEFARVLSSFDCSPSRNDLSLYIVLGRDQLTCLLAEIAALLAKRSNCEMYRDKSNWLVLRVKGCPRNAGSGSQSSRTLLTTSSLNSSGIWMLSSSSTSVKARRTSGKASMYVPVHSPPRLWGK